MSDNAIGSYWHDEYWPKFYWHDEYWQEFGIAGADVTKIRQHAKDAKDRLLFQYKGKTNIENLIDSLLGTQIQDFENAAFTLFGRLNIDKSTGKQLDRIGDLIGQKREGKIDSLYRLFIKAKIGANISQGDIERLISVWKLLTNSSSVHLVEAFPAEVELYSDTALSTSSVNDAFTLIQKVSAGGVKVGYTAVFDKTEAFGFLGSGSNSLGFGGVLSQGTNSSVGAFKLIDSGATFQTSGVTTNMIVYNTTDANIKSNIVSIDSETQLTLLTDIFTAATKDYYINKNVGGKLSFIQGN